jgi:hypothetical protein
LENTLKTNQHQASPRHKTREALEKKLKHHKKKCFL